jgi:hypothetical protein
MTIPDPWEAIILAAAAYRLWRLFSVDEITDPIRRRLLRLGDWREEGDPVPEGYREKWAIFLECPWCAGFHVSLGVWLLWVWLPTEVLFVCIPFALSAAVGIIRGKLDPPED